MTAMSRIKFCLYCDRPIEGAAIRIRETEAGASMSGARPDNYRHVKGDPACRAPRR